MIFVIYVINVQKWFTDFYPMEPGKVVRMQRPGKCWASSVTVLAIKLTPLA